jgi:hypothetical protein
VEFHINKQFYTDCCGVFIKRAETEETDARYQYAGNADTHHSPEHFHITNEPMCSL